MLTVAIWNLKGGTTKSTTAINLGASLARSKYKVLLIDLDGQRTLSFGVGMDGATPTVLDWLDGKMEPLETAVKNLLVIPGNIGMFRIGDADFAKSLKGLIPLELDVLLLDCPLIWDLHQLRQF